MPVGRCSKYGSGRRSRWRKTCAAEHRVDAVAGMQHEVLAQPRHRRVEDHEHAERRRAIATSVLCVWWTTTLSMTTCVKSGVASPTSWMASEASSTSRQMALCRASSGTNQRKPNAAGPGIRIIERWCGARRQQHRLLEVRSEVVQRERTRCLLSGEEVQKPLAVGAHEKRRHRHGGSLAGCAALRTKPRQGSGRSSSDPAFAPARPAFKPHAWAALSSVARS